MSIFSGSAEVLRPGGVYTGSTEVRAVYSGSDLVWENGVEYTDAFWGDTVSLHPLDSSTIDYTQKVSGGPSLSATTGVDAITQNLIGAFYGVRLGHTRLNTTSIGSSLLFSSNPLITSGDFTIEFWFYSYRAQISPDSNDHFLVNTTEGTTSGGRWKSVANSDRHFFAWDGTESGSGRLTGSWQHLAVSRSGSTVRMFVDGVLRDTFTSTAVLGSSLYQLRMGALGTTSELGRFTCDSLFRQVRFTAAARYTAAFIPKQVFYYPGI